MTAQQPGQQSDKSRRESQKRNQLHRIRWIIVIIVPHSHRCWNCYLAIDTSGDLDHHSTPGYLYDPWHNYCPFPMALPRLI